MTNLPSACSLPASVLGALDTEESVAQALLDKLSLVGEPSMVPSPHPHLLCDLGSRKCHAAGQESLGRESADELLEVSKGTGGQSHGGKKRGGEREGGTAGNG